MAQVSCEDLIVALRGSGLFDESHMADVEREVAPLEFEDTQDLIRHLIINRHATLYQIRKVLNGKTDELFIGPFTVLDKIGEGGMGKVFKAVSWKQPDKNLALKVVRAHLLANPVIKRRYDREVEAASALQHPNIVSVHDSGECDGRYYMAMEFVDGIDLAKIVKDYGRLLIPEACEYVRQASLGLHHAHTRGFVHRDVKPSNILVSGERHIPESSAPAIVKLLDMGLVRSVGFQDEAEKDDLTRVGMVVGTPDYMSPEQALNSSTVDTRADIYSLGCTLFYLLIGRPPYPEGTPMEKLWKHRSEPVPLLRDVRPEVPETLSKYVATLMAKSPDGRPADAASVAASLEPFTRYDFRPPPNPGKKRDAASRVQLPSAPTAAAPTAGGHYSLADDLSGTGEANHARESGSSVVGLPAVRIPEAGLSGHTPTDHGPLTGRIPRRAAALVAVAEKPAKAASKKPRKRGRRRRRKDSGNLTWLLVIGVTVLGALAMLMWLVKHIQK